MKFLKTCVLIPILLTIALLFFFSCTNKTSKPYVNVILNTGDTISLPSNFSKIDSNYIFNYANENYERFINDFISGNMKRKIYHKSNILVNSERDDHVIFLLRTNKIDPSKDLLILEKKAILKSGEILNCSVNMIDTKIVKGDLNYIKVESEFKCNTKFKRNTYRLALEDQGCYIIEYFKSPNNDFEEHLDKIKMSLANKIRLFNERDRKLDLN